MRAGDFTGWLELVHKEQNVPAREQYRYIDDNVDTAISLISGNAADVTILVSECFEASLRFMESKIALNKGAADNFLRSKTVVANASKRQNNTDFDDLREKSKQYFPEEYKFYNAAVEQFKRQLDSLQLRQYCDI